MSTVSKRQFVNNHNFSTDDNPASVVLESSAKPSLGCRTGSPSMFWQKIIKLLTGSSNRCDDLLFILVFMYYRGVKKHTTRLILVLKDVALIYDHRSDILVTFLLWPHSFSCSKELHKEECLTPWALRTTFVVANSTNLLGMFIFV